MSIDPHSLQRVMEIVRTAARQLVGADGVAFVLEDGGQCWYVEEDAVGPLWKGQRFPLDVCVSGWVISHNVPAVIPDIYDDPRVLVEAYRPTFVRSMAMVPVGSPAVAALGAYWAQPHEATQSQLESLAAIADSAFIESTP
jgi:hypothetical protein